MLIAQMVNFSLVFVVLAILAAGTIAGVMSIGASLFVVRSKFGWTTGGIALGVGIILPLVIMIVSWSSRHLIALLYLWLALPAVLGAIGIGLTRVPAGRILMALRVTIVGGSVVALALLGHWRWQRVVAGREMMELLGGSSEIRIADFSVDGQQRRVVCNDRVVCDYLTAALRRATPAWRAELHGAGDGYDFTFHFASSSEYQVFMSAYTNGLRFSIPEADPPEEGKTHDAEFDPPIPARLTEIGDFLGQPNRKVAGSLLVAAEGEPTRVEKPPALDLR
jgi:hypothetical protein